MAHPEDYYAPYRHMTRMDLNAVESFRALKALLRGRIADIGCGIGYITHFLGAEGVDISAEAIEAAKALYPGTPFHHRDITREGLPGTFDSINCYNVLEHVSGPQQEAFISALKSGLKPGGFVLFGYADPFHPMQLVSGILQRRVLFDPTHHFNWSVPAFRRYLSKYFRITSESRTSPFTRLVGFGKHFKGDVLIRCENPLSPT